jgi:hypothetical protein
MNKHHSRHPLVPNHIIFIIITALLAIGCGGGGGGGGGSTSTATPEDTIKIVSSAAVKGDNTTVLSYFFQGAETKYPILFSDNESLIALGNGLSKAVEVKRKDNLVIYRATYADNGVDIAYYIYVKKDNSGKWIIDNF